jgi:putative hydrolase of the HAD superfamily
VHQLLERFELATMVSAVVVSADIGWRKPRPEIFRAALERTGLAPEDVVFVGDSWEEDVLGAAALGMATVWIDPGASPGPIAEEPRGWVIPQIHELRSVSFVAAD